jgi:hypothetical protein
MLEELLIFMRGDMILWLSCRALGVSAALKGSPIDALIRSCLLEERSIGVSFQQDSYTLKWTFNNDPGLVFVAVYQSMLHLLYVEDLLTAIRKEFTQIYDDGFAIVHHAWELWPMPAQKCSVGDVRLRGTVGCADSHSHGATAGGGFGAGACTVSGKGRQGVGLEPAPLTVRSKVTENYEGKSG